MTLFETSTAALLAALAATTPYGSANAAVSPRLDEGAKDDPFVPRSIRVVRAKRRRRPKQHTADVHFDPSPSRATTTSATRQLSNNNNNLFGHLQVMGNTNTATAGVDIGILEATPTASTNACDGVDRPVIGPSVNMQNLVYKCLTGNTYYGRYDYDNYDCTVLPCWNTSQVTNLSYAFEFAENFDEPLENWDVSGVRDMSAAFYGAASFNQPLASWDFSSVEDASDMFYGASRFDQPLESWQTTSLKNTAKMFYYASRFNHPLEGWQMSGVTDASRMFSGATLFDQPLGGWDVSNVRDTTEMFYLAAAFDRPLDGWDVSGVTSMAGMFYYAGNFDQCLSTWAGKTLSNVTVVNMFKQSGCPSTPDPDPSALDPWCRTRDGDPSCPLPTTRRPKSAKKTKRKNNKKSKKRRQMGMGNRKR